MNKLICMTPDLFMPWPRPLVFSQRKSNGGFTLIELMIVVAVVAILAAVAYPSYTESVRKSRRADAQSVLLEAAQFLERFHTENNRYDQNTATPPVAFALPGYLLQSPKEGATKFYNLTVPTITLTQQGYTLTATPITPGAQAGDRCANMTFTNTGAKGTSSTQTDCWRR